jgi:transposase-like protein
VLTVVPGAADADDPRGAGGAGDSAALIDEIVREGARRMLAEALQAEVDAYIAQFLGERDEHGPRLVVRNGSHQPREVLTSAGAVEVVAPRVNDRRIDPDTGERRRFSSAILPPWCRKTPKITEVLPLLYLHGLSSGDFAPALGQFLGSSAGLSGPVITKLTETWKAEQRTFAARDLSGVDYVYLWADGIHVNIRLDEHKLCLLVMIGVRADGRKELVALTDDYRESVGAGGRQPDRVDLRHRPTPHQDHPWTGLAGTGPGDGVQAHRGRPGPLARGQRSAPRRARPCRRHLRGRQARRTTRAAPSTGSRLKNLIHRS